MFVHTVVKGPRGNINRVIIGPLDVVDEFHMMKHQVECEGLLFIVIRIFTATQAPGAVEAKNSEIYTSVWR